MVQVNLLAVGVAETEAIGACLASTSPTRAMVYLRGDLGAGKTTWVRGFAQALGHQGVVKSPTYTLVEPYELGNIQLFHFDLYRLHDPQELEYMGARDLFGAQAVCLIEWPERGGGELPDADLVVQLRVTGAHRQVFLSSLTSIGERWLTAAQACLTTFLSE